MSTNGCVRCVDAGNSTSTLRRRTLAVGQRLDTQMQGETAESDVPKRLDSLVSMGLDSGFVRDCQPRSERSFAPILSPNLELLDSFCVCIYK